MNSTSMAATAEVLPTLVGGDRVIAVVGAGGKKTTMYALARLHAGRVALSSTSHMYPYDRRGVDAVVVLGDGDVPTVADAGARVVAFSGPTETAKRVGGLAAPALAGVVADPSFSLILVKADGARARWIKAPAPYEPLIPEFAERVIYIVSARAVGRPLDARIAHRQELVAEVTGATLDAPITPGHVGRLIASERGGMKDVGRACVLPLINAVDDAEQHGRAREAARAALASSDRFDRVVLASMQAPRIVEIVER